MHTYHCRKIDRPLRLTGKADDLLWSAATEVQLVEAVSGRAPRQSTAVRLLYNADALYVAFRCVDTYVWGDLIERDSAIFTQECVEAFLCPSCNEHYYYEINVSPLNTVFDAFILNSRTRTTPGAVFTGFAEYTCAGLETLVHIDGQLGVHGATGWSAEYAIPFSSLVGHANTSPKPGDEWRLNLYRIDEPTKGDIELSAWSPPGVPDFHTPWHFGRLVFE